MSLSSNDNSLATRYRPGSAIMTPSIPISSNCFSSCCACLISLCGNKRFISTNSCICTKRACVNSSAICAIEKVWSELNTPPSSATITSSAPASLSSAISSFLSHVMDIFFIPPYYIMNSMHTI